MAGLARLCTRIFFRRVEVVGRENLPVGSPVLLVANHHNSMVDPVLVLASTRVHARFLAKSTLWKVPGIRQLLQLAAVIPVYRAQDGSDMSQNQETFSACHEELGRGGAIALFPEGISHDAPHLARLKTGAARIAMGAITDQGAVSLRIVPVGLTFEEKGTFRSRALVRIGEPIDPTPFAQRAGEESFEAARELTDAIREGLHQVTLNYPSRDEATLIDQAADLYSIGERELPARMALAAAFAVRRTFIEAYDRLRARDSERVDALAKRVAAYADSLGKMKVREEQLAARFPSEAVAAQVFGTAWLLLFWLPLASVGTAISYLPYRLCGVVARFMKTGDLPATVKLWGGFFLFPITWLIWCGLAYSISGAGAALGMAIGAPVSSWFAMRFHERYERFFDDATAWLRLRWKRAEADELRREREAIRENVEELRALDEAEKDPGGAGPPGGDTVSGAAPFGAAGQSRPSPPPGRGRPRP